MSYAETVLGTLKVVYEADTTDMERGVSRAEGVVDSFSHTMSVAAGVMVRDFINGGIRAVSSAINKASDNFVEYESTLARIIGATSETGAEAEILSSFLQDVAEAQTDLGYSAREASKALEAFVKAGFDGEQAAEALRAALMLARVEGVDTESAANLLVQTLTQFKLKAEDAEDALNLISKAATAGIDTAGGYAAGLSNVGAQASAMGFNLKDTLGALVILDQTFGSAQESGTFLNMLFKDMTTKTDDLGFSLYNADGSMRSLSEIVDELRTRVDSFGGNQKEVNEYLSMFDVRAQRAVTALVNYDGGLSDVTESMDLARDVTDKTNLVMETAAGRYARLASEQENLTLELGAMSTELDIAWKQFALGLGPIGAVVDALGPTMLQGAMTGLTVMLPSIWKHLGSLNDIMGVTGLSAQTLAIGLGAAVGSFTLIYGAIQGLPPEMRDTASVIAILTGALVAATVAAAAFYGTISLGVAVPVILAGVGAAVAGVMVSMEDAEKTAEELQAKIGALGDEAVVTGTKFETMAETEEEALERGAVVLEDFYNQLITISDEAYSAQLEELNSYYDTKYNAEQTELEKLVDLINEYYDEKADAARDNYDEQISQAQQSFDDELTALNSFLAEKLSVYGISFGDLRTEAEKYYDDVMGEINDHYDEELDRVRSAYDEEIAETEAFYDQQISVITAGLSEIRGLRSEELNQMELDYLRQKTVLESQHEQGIISEEEYQEAINDLESNYQDDRSTARDAWRIQELEYELSHKEELESLEEEKKQAILTKQEELSEDLAQININRNSTIEEIAAELQPTLETISENLNISLTEAAKLLNSELDSINQDRNDDVKNAYDLAESFATIHQTALDDIETNRAQSRADSIKNIYKGIVTAFRTYVGDIEGLASEGSVSAQKIQRAAEETRNALVAIGQEAKIDFVGPPRKEIQEASEEYDTSIPQQRLFEMAKSAYQSGDMNSYIGYLAEAVALGYISAMEYQTYTNGIPGAAKGAIVTGPTQVMVGEGGDDEAIIPLNRSGMNKLYEAIKPLIQPQSSGLSVIVDIHDNTFTSEFDVENKFKEETTKLTQKLLSQGFGRT